MQQRTEKILASAKNELSVCASSGVSMLFVSHDCLVFD